jgi:hypothetical protein
MNNEENWLNSKWRPMMAWTYMLICLFDFLIAPIAVGSFQLSQNLVPQLQWIPLSLQGGGLLHISMGAVIGISAYGRTQEKLNAVANI